MATSQWYSHQKIGFVYGRIIANIGPIIIIAKENCENVKVCTYCFILKWLKLTSDIQLSLIVIFPKP